MGWEATEEIIYHKDTENTEFRNSENFEKSRNSAFSVSLW